jgi:hypothetical protein
VRELYRGEHIIVTLDEGRKLLWRRRTAAPYRSSEQAALTYEAVIRASEPVQGPEYVLLSDMRLAPPRNDPFFEQVVHQHYDRLYAGFRKIALLVYTEVGRLQAQRMARPSVVGRLRCFCDEREALAYLLNPASPSIPPGR